MSTFASADAQHRCVRATALSLLEARALDGFEPVSPELLAQRDLLQRTDTKYLLPRRLLPELLACLDRDYRVLHTGEQPSAVYITRYLDTPSFELFHDHRRGKRRRFKVRLRHYPDRRLSYLEVKGKSSSGGTRKWRRPLAYLCEQLSRDDFQFVSGQTPLDGASLVPSLVTEFHRITLVGIELPERITLDMDLKFANDESSHALSGVLVIEVKQSRFFRRSPVVQALARYRALPGSTSKYCVGTMLLRPDLRHNRLRPTLARIERVCQC
jgi:hypothetical protein